MSRSENFARFAETGAVAGDLKRKSVHGALATAAVGGLDFVLRIGSTLILARLLVPEHFGLVAMVTAFTRMAEQFATLGLSTATVQAPKVTHEQCSNLFWVNVAAGLLFALALVASSPAIAAFYDNAELRSIAMAVSLNFVWTGLTVQHDALLRRQMKLPRVAANQLVATFLSAGIAIVLALTGFGFWALVSKDVIRAFLVAVGAWILCPWLPSLPSRRVDMQRLLGFGRDMTLTQILLSVSAQLDSVLIGRFAGAFDLGLFRQAQNLMKQPIERLNTPIATVSQPGLSILQAEPARYRRYYQRILYVVGLVTMPLGVFAAIYAHEIVLVALGEKWLGAVVFLRIFALVAAIQPALATSGMVLITCGRSSKFLFVSLVYSAVSMSLMFVGTRWGSVGIAAAHLAAAVVLTPWMLSYSFAQSPVSIGAFWQSVSRPIAASLAMGVALVSLQRFAGLEGAPLSLAAALGTALAVYFPALILVPGGRAQLFSLVHELTAALRRRSNARPDSGNEEAPAL